MPETFEERVAKANVELAGLLAKYHLTINAELVYQPNGLTPSVKFTDTYKNMENENNVEPTETEATPVVAEVVETTEVAPEATVEEAPVA